MSAPNVTSEKLRSLISLPHDFGAEQRIVADKSAQIFIGAATLGGARFSSPENIARICGRADEHYRQKVLKL